MSTTMSTTPHRPLALPILALASILAASPAVGSPSPRLSQATPAARIPTIEAIDGMSPDELRAALSTIVAVRNTANLSDEAKAEAARAFDRAIARLRLDSTPASPSTSQVADAVPATYARLVGLRASILSVEEQLGSRGLVAERRAELQRDLSVLNDQMGQFTDDCAPASERIPVEQSLVMVASRAQSLFQHLPRQIGRQNDAVEFYIDSIKADLRGSHSTVDLQLEQPTQVVRVSGKRWEVEEAKRALRDGLPAYIARLQELIATEEMVQSDRDKARFLDVERSTVNVNWRGGTLQELVTSVQALVECNVVLADPAVGALVIPALAVKRVAPEVFFRSLQSLPLADDAQIVVTVVAPEAADEGKPGQSMPNRGGPVIATSPVIVIKQRFNASSLLAPTTLAQRIFDLSDWPGADAKGIKSLIEAVDFAMQADGSAEQVKVRYHEPSRILFAKGPAASVKLIDEIVTAFRAKK
jgi:hypothetical protein